MAAVISSIRMIGARRAQWWCMKHRIVIAGYVYASNQNGVVHDTSGICQCLGVGQHSGVEPKIKVVYEKD